jgi:predicted N-formylglutamate amidohydrolase
MTYQPYHIEGADRPSRWLVTCDHAANTVPQAVHCGSLGLPAAEMARHIAFDPGAAGVTRELARLLNGRAILSNFSRLVIDPNRGEDDPTLVMKLYDGTIIPGNRHVTAEEIEARKALCYRPYHGAYAALAERVPDTAIVAVHSYTPQLVGRPPRPWHVGILFGADDRLSLPFLDRLRHDPELVVGANEPYTGHLPGDSIWRHALAQRRQNTLIEIRNDLIRTEAQQKAWAARLAPVLEQALRDAEPATA